MKEAKSGTTTMFMDEKSSGIIAHGYLFSVVGLLTGLALGVGSCASTVNPQNTPPVATGSSQTSSRAQTSREGALAKQELPEGDLLRVDELSAREESGQTLVQLKLSKRIQAYRHFPVTQPSRIVLDIFDDAKSVPQAESFRIDTNWVAALRLSSIENHLRLVVDIAAASVPPYTISQDDDGLKILIGALDPNSTGKKRVTLYQGGRRIDTRPAETATAATTETKSPASSADQGSISEKKYTGQKISLDFKDADIKNVFRLLAEVSGLNIVVTNEVNRKVTLRLVEVPWDQALDLLIDTNGLGKEQVGNVVRISTAGQLKTERDALAAARKAEENLEPLQTVYFNINYAKVRDLEAKVKTLLTKRPDASLVIDERSNTIMVRDVKKVVEDVSTLIAKLDTRTPQVLIESNLIETTPTFARALGVRLQFTSGGTTISNAAGAGGGNSPFTAVTPPFPNAPIGLGGTVSVIQNSLGGLRNVASVLEAAENEGNIRIISRPSVVTLNNIASTIRSERILRITLPASTNIATGTGSSAAGAAVATEKVPVGIILTVTPQVSSDGYVLMNINVKSSTVAPGTVTSGTAGVIPFDELNREAVANVLVRDGETIVIGGILKDTSQDSESGVPYLKDIPVLGWLFKNQRLQKDFEELMVFITPRLTSAGSTNLPTAEQLWREQLGKTAADQPILPTQTP
jgi:type IV pilus assembly protein PilQ